MGDGEAETGPLATAWHSNKFLNPIRDGAVLPILNLNGYKIANPTFLARISHDQLEKLSKATATRRTSSKATTRTRCIRPWPRRWTMPSRTSARSSGTRARRRCRPAALADDCLRTPKGWTGPKEIDGRKAEGSWRSHQVPLADVRENPAHLKMLEDWLRSYKPEELFDDDGRLVAELSALAPTGTRRMGANPHANGGLLAKNSSCRTFATTP